MTYLVQKKYKNNFLYFMYVLSILLAILSCQNSNNKTKNIILNKDFDFEVIPETFSLKITIEDGYNKETILASSPQEKRKVENLKNKNGKISWYYPEEKINVEIEKNIEKNIDKKSEENCFLQINITYSNNDFHNFTFPYVQADKYYLPINEGIVFDSDDKYFKKFLLGEKFNVLEKFSMQFFSFANSYTNYENIQQKSALVFITENIYNNFIEFPEEDNISFVFSHDFIPINTNKSFSFRIYVTEDNPLHIAKTYKNYIKEKGNLKTLKEKESENKNISKLYGASHIYLFNSFAITEKSVDFKSLKNNINSPVINHIKNLLVTNKEFLSVIKNIEKNSYIDNYQKNTVLRELSSMIFSSNFYDEKVFTEKNEVTETLLKKGINNLSEKEIIVLNKNALYLNIKDIFTEEPNKWASDRGYEIIEDMKNSELKKLWIGLDNWNEAFLSEQLTQYAADFGYLIAPYDSYHSIHKKDFEQWHTAAFENAYLFEDATIENSKGKKYGGFKNVGRKLNPTLAFEEVENRVNKILYDDESFNSWFIDCDATGEVFDDYSEKNITTKEEDIKARLFRMTWLNKEKKMIVGSEGGNDYAASSIAFAHGIELPTFSWMDKDMKDKKSEYYIGEWYSYYGGVPNHFSKVIPVKEYFKKIFLSPKYRVPLYKLVYNESIITTYHWDWSTFKIKDEYINRMLHEISFNIPPMYHIDDIEWKKYKDKIIPHSEMFLNFSQKVINLEMTDFKLLDENIVLTEYGNKIKVIVNYRDSDYRYEDFNIAKKSLIIIEGENTEIYSPK